MVKKEEKKAFDSAEVPVVKPEVVETVDAETTTEEEPVMIGGQVIDVLKQEEVEVNGKPYMSVLSKTGETYLVPLFDPNPHVKL